MKNYVDVMGTWNTMCYKYDDNKNIVACDPNDKECKTYTPSNDNYIINYEIKDNSIIVLYANNHKKRLKYTKENLKIVKDQIQIQLTMLVNLYRCGLIPIVELKPIRFLSRVTLATCCIILSNNESFQYYHDNISIYSELPAWLILGIFTCGYIIIPEVFDNLYRKEIKRDVEKLDYYYTHRIDFDQYFKKTGNDAITEVENMKMSKLVKVLKEYQNNLQ